MASVDSFGIPYDPVIDAMIRETKLYPSYHRSVLHLLNSHRFFVVYRDTIHPSDAALEIFYRHIERKKAHARKRNDM